MPVIVIDEIFDPVGNSQLHKLLPTVHWQYVGMERKYSVQIDWQSPQGEKSMYHTIDMHCAGMKEGKAVWEITKDNFYVDNKKPEDHISLLAIACAAPYYPFEFLATKNGQIDNVLHIDKLRKRYAEAKPILLRNFSGDIAEEYIEAVEKSLQDQKLLKTIVTEDTWLSLFFTDIIGEYDYETKNKEVTIEFPFSGFEKPLLFKGSATIDNRSEDSLKVIFAGILAFPQFIEDKILMNGYMQIIYDLHIPTYHIRNIMCDASIITEQGEYKTIVDGYEIIKKETIQIKEEKVKSERVGWMAFFS